MRNPKFAKMHLMKAHQAVKDGDGAKARHHVGHAFSALKEGPALRGPSQTSNDAMDPGPSTPQNATPSPVKLNIMDRLKMMAKKSY